MTSSSVTTSPITNARVVVSPFFNGMWAKGYFIACLPNLSWTFHLLVFQSPLTHNAPLLLPSLLIAFLSPVVLLLKLEVFLCMNGTTLNHKEFI